MQRCPNPLAALAHRFVRQADDRELRQPRRNLHLDINRHRLDAPEGHGGYVADHLSTRFAPLCREELKNIKGTKASPEEIKRLWSGLLPLHLESLAPVLRRHAWATHSANLNDSVA